MKILVGYDGSNAGKAALDIAKLHAKVMNASVAIIISMAKGTENERDNIQQAERNLEYAKSLYGQEKIECSTHLLIRGMAPGEDIVMFARENLIDEIVIGVKRRSKIGKILMGSTAQYVILNAHCPVVSVK